jgi:hypothetical protein
MRFNELFPNPPPGTLEPLEDLPGDATDMEDNFD